MKRTPVMFWLLLVATLAVDAVEMFWMNNVSAGPAAGTLFEALSFSQLSVVCIWAVLSPRPKPWTAAVLVAATLAAAALMAVLFAMPLLQAVAIYGSQATVLSLLLWVVKRTKIWQWGRLSTQPIKWQFSVAQLLVLMTVIAILLVSFRDNQLVQDAEARQILKTLLIFNASIAVAAVVVWSQPWHVIGRLAVLLVVAAIIGWLAGGRAPSEDTYYFASCVVQSLVLFAWLELGGIIPRGEPAAEGESPAAAGPDRRE